MLSKDSPSGEMKAVVRECTIKGEDKQFLEVCSCVSAAELALTLFTHPAKGLCSNLLFLIAPRVGLITPTFFLYVACVKKKKTRHMWLCILNLTSLTSLFS